MIVAFTTEVSGEPGAGHVVSREHGASAAVVILSSCPHRDGPVRKRPFDCVREAVPRAKRSGKPSSALGTT